MNKEHKNKKTQRYKSGQATIEFTFAMVMVALLIYGLIKIFQWVGMDYAEKASAQQRKPLFVASKSTVTPDERTSRLVAYTHNF